MISYLDNAATTLPCKAAAEAMERATREIYGNPSSLHAMGLEAEKAVNEARAQVAAAMTKQKLADVKKPEKQIIFTSCGTEANNLAIIGTAMAKKTFCRQKNNPRRIGAFLCRGMRKASIGARFSRSIYSVAARRMGYGKIPCGAGQRCDSRFRHGCK